MQEKRFTHTIQIFTAYPVDKIEKFVLEEHPYFDGESSKRVLNAVEDFIDKNELKRLKSKPLNLIRKYKMCKKLNYFKF